MGLQRTTQFLKIVYKDEDVDQTNPLLRCREWVPHRNKFGTRNYWPSITTEVVYPSEYRRIIENARHKAGGDPSIPWYTTEKLLKTELPADFQSKRDQVEGTAGCATSAVTDTVVDLDQLTAEDVVPSKKKEMNLPTEPFRFKKASLQSGRHDETKKTGPPPSERMVVLFTGEALSLIHI